MTHGDASRRRELLWLSLPDQRPRRELYWMSRMPDTHVTALAADEPAGSWELERVALVLGIWCVLGLLLCIRTFRWQDRG